MIEILADFIEWFGTIAVLGAFGLAMFHVIPFESKMFYVMNLAGAIAMVFGGAFKRQSWKMVIFFAIWAIITALVFFNPFHWHF